MLRGPCRGTRDGGGRRHSRSITQSESILNAAELARPRLPSRAAITSPLPSAWALGPPEGGVSVRPVPPTKRAGGELRNQYRSSIPELSNCNPELRSGIVTGHVVDPARESARLSRGWQSPQAPGSTGRSQADLVVDPARESLGLHGSRRSLQAPAQAVQALGGRRSDRAAVG